MWTNVEDAPRWASAPGETIRRVLDAKGLSTEDLADALDVSDPQARRLIDGEMAVTAECAEKLAALLGSTARFWENREAIYRDSLLWLQADELARRAPLLEMTRRGWITAQPGGWRMQAEALLEFFDVADAAEWGTVWTARLSGARYRTSQSFESDELSVAAWLRRAEVEAARHQPAAFSRDALLKQIAELRELTKIGDPRRFIPLARRSLESAGVALVVLQATNENRISGATFKLSDGTRVIALSARHLAEDHLWFTLFHEIGHLILHDGEGDFLDTLDSDQDATGLEQEANHFAREHLLPGGIESLCSSRTSGPTMRQIMRFAAVHRIAPGIVVGRLRHDGVLTYAQQGRLIRRYQWSGTDLIQKT